MSSDLVSPADDELHPPASDHPWWTETCWFSFDQPGDDLSGTVYPLFRPNLGVCSLAVYVWDASAHEPWQAPYGAFLWHLPMPTTGLAHLDLAGLRYDVEEPLQAYRVRYADGDRLELDLRYEGLIAPHGIGIAHGHGHLDQPCHVTGQVRLGRRTVEIDSLAMRDRSWHVRDDRRSTRSAYTYGLAGPGESFLAVSMWDEGSQTYQVRTGFLVRDGEKELLVSGERRVTGRRHGYPTSIELEASDAAGRRLEATGRCRNRLANPATPGLFAWMSMTAWEVAGGLPAVGEDQDIWSPDRLGELLALRRRVVTPDAYRAFLTDLGLRLERDDRVLGLVALGSTAAVGHEPDEWSDHDLFVVAVPGHEEPLRTDLSWLPGADAIVLALRETEHGVKVLYASGHLVELAVFTPDQLALARVNRYRVLLDRSDVAARMAAVRQATERAAGGADDDHHVGMFLTNLVVGAGRFARGERLSAQQLVAGDALGHLLALLACHVPAEGAALLDDLDGRRRVERVHPGLGAELDAAVLQPAPEAARRLLAVAGRELAPRLAGRWPAAAAEVVAAVVARSAAGEAGGASR